MVSQTKDGSLIGSKTKKNSKIKWSYWLKAQFWTPTSLHQGQVQGLQKNVVALLWHPFPTKSLRSPAWNTPPKLRNQFSSLIQSWVQFKGLFWAPIIWTQDPNIFFHPKRKNYLGMPMPRLGEKMMLLKLHIFFSFHSLHPDLHENSFT